MTGFTATSILHMRDHLSQDTPAAGAITVINLENGLRKTNEAAQVHHHSGLATFNSAGLKNHIIKSQSDEGNCVESVLYEWRLYKQRYRSYEEPGTILKDSW